MRNDPSNNQAARNFQGVANLSDAGASQTPALLPRVREVALPTPLIRVFKKQAESVLRTERKLDKALDQQAKKSARLEKAKIHLDDERVEAATRNTLEEPGGGLFDEEPYDYCLRQAEKRVDAAEKNVGKAGELVTHYQKKLEAHLDKCRAFEQSYLQ